MQNSENNKGKLKQEMSEENEEKNKENIDMVSFDSTTGTYTFPCPHCKVMCMVAESDIRCEIFRHANFKKGMRLVPPHASKAECMSWVENGKVWGCGKPFRFNGKQVEICGYI